MRCWTKRMVVALGGFLVIVILSGATYQWLAIWKDLAATPPPGQLVDVGGV